VPLTHREHTKVVTFVTGHDVRGHRLEQGRHTETLVIFMGIFAFDEIARALIAQRPRRRYARHGRALGHAAGSANARRERWPRCPA
jgi:siroheme synthase